MFLLLFLLNEPGASSLMVYFVQLHCRLAAGRERAIFPMSLLAGKCPHSSPAAASLTRSEWQDLAN